MWLGLLCLLPTCHYCVGDGNKIDGTFVMLIEVQAALLAVKGGKIKVKNPGTLSLAPSSARG